MSFRRVALCLILPLAGGCLALPLPRHAGADTAGESASLPRLNDADYPPPPAVAYLPHDPQSPAWDVGVVRLDAERVRFDLRMKSLVTGGEGEARQVFVRAAQRIADAGGFAGFEVVRYEESVESSWPFAQRTAVGEVRLVRSRIWPAM
ncbi:hypothetical protein PA01_17845 [Azoarcus sp. PA01]|nr:hypothetical protein PA01_17845 [Azoarcus sp. PA01]